VDQIADFELIRQLGGGSQGVYYLATSPPRLGTGSEYVAVKVLVAPTTETGLRRISRELRAFASAQSPRLVRLLDAGQDGDRFYYAMEYFPGGSLAAPAQVLSRAESLRAVAEAALAAHALHEVGLVHRDIKPANILLGEDGARLSDLGLAQLLAPGQTVTAMGPVGSVEYTDPAILRGERGSRATDIWSLGATLHRAVSGEGIYGDLPTDDPLLSVRKVLTAPPVLSERLTSEERRVVAACLESDAGRRPLTAAELAGRIQDLVPSA